jgi:hypothetical protein
MNNFLDGLNLILRVELCMLMLKLKILMTHCNFFHLNIIVTQTSKELQAISSC